MTWEEIVLVFADRYAEHSGWNDPDDKAQALETAEFFADICQELGVVD